MHGNFGKWTATRLDLISIYGYDLGEREAPCSMFVLLVLRQCVRGKELWEALEIWRTARTIRLEVVSNGKPRYGDRNVQIAGGFHMYRLLMLSRGQAPMTPRKHGRNGEKNLVATCQDFLC